MKYKRIKENQLSFRIYKTEFFFSTGGFGNRKIDNHLFFLLLPCSLHINIYPYHTTVLGLSFCLPFLTELFDCLSFEDLAPGM